jgi:DNA-binding PucR family transcriptional regulator
LQQRTATRAARVRELLQDARSDIADSENTLGYQISTRLHLALVVWTSTEKLLKVGGSQLVRFTGQLAERLGCAASPLFLPFDQVTAWAWLPFDNQAPSAEALRTAVGAIGAGVAVAVGEPAADIAGFRRSHQQAQMVQATMLAASDTSTGVATFDEIGPIALFCRDLEATRTWVGEKLGRLALDDAQQARQRETLRVFLATGGSFVAAANQLSLHRNSVYYRVRKAEEQLGGPIDGDRLDVEIALKACRWLGRSVLIPNS